MAERAGIRATVGSHASDARPARKWAEEQPAERHAAAAQATADRLKPRLSSRPFGALWAIVQARSSFHPICVPVSRPSHLAIAGSQPDCHQRYGLRASRW
jgi:hypothetical protein